MSTLVPASAQAYEIRGVPWPDRPIYYFSQGDAKSTLAVDRAARAWNRARVGVRFVRTSGLRADVVIAGGGSRCTGRATIGYSAVLTSRLYVGRCGAGRMQLTVAHELGHVLGLGHERSKCALMNPTARPDGSPSRCARRSLAYWLARPLRKDDIRGARAVRALR